MKISIKSTIKIIRQWFLKNQNDIMLVIGVILISLLSFAMGYIAAKTQEKEPLIFEMSNSQFPISNETENIK